MGIQIKITISFRTFRISTIVFQISNLLSFIKRDSQFEGLFFVSNVFCSFLVLVHIEKMQELKPSHREYCSNHSRK